MRKVLKWTGLVLGGLLVLLLLVGGAMYVVGGSKLSRTYAVQPADLAIPTDSAAVARGAYLATTHACTACHGARFEGQVMVDAPPFRVTASNLTRGQGGIGARYTDADWDRTIRHGVRPDGRPVVIMPSAAFHGFADADAAALIAYLKSLSPVDNPLPETELRALGRVIVGAGGIDPAIEVRTEPAPRTAPAAGPTAAYGAYIASTFCTYCHGQDLRGDQPPEPGTPYAPGLDAAGQWPLDLFREVLRTGVLPGGRRLDESMPIEQTSQMTDDDLAALHAHLQTVGPARPPDA